ncbi:MAG: MBL fold metallo-hydrolase [Spirochaetes bacterium]|nr:MBL fold metallo-hydrolase [Spirochaetota bacterium]
MKIRFWGVRGSIPTPLTPEKLKSKISSVVQRINLDDIESQESRELFIARLPESIFSTVGGNTSCVEVKTDEHCHLIFDAGTGIQNLGRQLAALKRPLAIHLFFSHFHWDHIQGLPFFAPAFDPANHITLYSPVNGFREILAKQMSPPYFPVGMEVMQACKEFCVVEGHGVKIGELTIRQRGMNHPGGCYSYSIEEHGHKIIYSTDTELSSSDFDRTPENERYFKSADALIIDTQYTLGEAIEKQDWGHSSFSLAADFASSWQIKKLILFHHEPGYNDQKIDTIFKSASWYLGHLEERGIEVILAREGLEIEL